MIFSRVCKLGSVLGWYSYCWEVMLWEDSGGWGQRSFNNCEYASDLKSIINSEKWSTVQDVSWFLSRDML